MPGPAPRFPGAIRTAEPRDWWWAVQVVVVVGLAVGTRTMRLASLPGEWYGDISTVYEYVASLRSGHRPPGWYALGIGPLHPFWVRPFLAVLGETYLAIKVASIASSLLGLGLLYRLACRLVDRSFALVATAIAAVGSWWLVYSRLGDVQALTPTLTLLALCATVRTVQRPGATGWAVMAGAASGLGVYLYGNTMVLPLLSAGTLAAAALWTRRSRRAWAGTAAAFLVGSSVLVPFVVEAVTRPDAVRGGHVASRLDLGWSTPAHVIDGYRTALEGYVGTGDTNARGNPPGRAHVDRLSLVLAGVGTLWWLRPTRRRRGLLVLGWFLALHLPFALATDNAGPSVSRTTAAAPLAYLLVAGGAWAMAGAMTRAWTGRGEIDAPGAGAANRSQAAWQRGAWAWVLVAAVAAVNLHAYFDTYERNLPYGNIPISGLVADEARAYPSGTGVHLVGYGWIDGMPATKSIAYQLGASWPVVEHAPETFDCTALGEISRPALVIWDPAQSLPAAGLAGCEADLGSLTLHTAGDGWPVFYAAVLR